jgi:putative acetyltransferase
MEVSIRLATAEDIEAIIDLQTKSISNLPDRFRKYDRQQIDSLVVGQETLRRFLFSGETTLVAEKDGDLVGFVSLVVSFQTKISALFVHPDSIGKGVGSELLRQLELIATENHIRIIVVASSIESVDFYKKNGYQFKRNTGFCSQELVWIPCELLEKELIPFTPAEKFARQTVKIVLSVVFLLIILAINHKNNKKPVFYCPATNSQICPQIIAP